MIVTIGAAKAMEESEWKLLEFLESYIALSWGVYNWCEPQTYNDYRIFQRIGPACTDYARKREELELTKTDIDIERERQRSYVPPVGALSTVMTEVRTKFMKQFKKGDYEKLIQYR